jgi:hypothetical protein
LLRRDGLRLSGDRRKSLQGQPALSIWSRPSGSPARLTLKDFLASLGRRSKRVLCLIRRPGALAKILACLIVPRGIAYHNDCYGG